jgi:hypothetical protein
MNEGDLVMGIDQAQLSEDAGRRALQRADHPKNRADKEENLQHAADKFNEAAGLRRYAHNYDKAADDSKDAGTALEAEGGLKSKAAEGEHGSKRKEDLEGAKKAYDGAATSLEAAAADRLNTKHSWSASDAQSYYEYAGKDRMEAGKAAGKNNDHKGAAEQYGQAQKDFINAKELATKAGDTKKADEYDKLADDAHKKAAKEEELVKLEKPQHGLPAHKDPRNYP